MEQEKKKSSYPATSNRTLSVVGSWARHNSVRHFPRRLCCSLSVRIIIILLRRIHLRVRVCVEDQVRLTYHTYIYIYTLDTHTHAHRRRREGNKIPEALIDVLCSSSYRSYKYIVLVVLQVVRGSRSNENRMRNHI